MFGSALAHFRQSCVFDTSWQVIMLDMEQFHLRSLLIANQTALYPDRFIKFVSLLPLFDAVICTLLSNSIGIVTQKNGFDKLLSQILKKILTIAFLFAQNVQKNKKAPTRRRGSLYWQISFLFVRGRRFFRRKNKARRKSLQDSPRLHPLQCRGECDNSGED